MSKQNHPLGDEAEEALAEAFYEYREKLEKIFNQFDNEQLFKFVGDKASQSILHNVINIERYSAFMKVIYRDTFEKAKEIIDAGAPGYCVCHNCDIRDCVNEH